jgi:hypothetical protein
MASLQSHPPNKIGGCLSEQGIETLQSVEKHVRISQKEKQGRVHEVHARLPSLKQSLEVSLEGADSGDQIDTTRSEDQRSGNVARVVPPGCNAGSSDSEK